MRPYLLMLFLILTTSCIANDTITVMQYNLLYYGANNSWCNVSNNDVNTKNHYIRTILDEVKPDIISVCEFANDMELIQSFVDNNLNINEIYSWKAAADVSTTNSNIINALFYNSDKISIKKHNVAQSHIRDIDVFELYFNTNDLIYGDTIELVCVSAHLKSGKGKSNENARKIMIKNTLDYLHDNYKNKNMLIMGDFNLYSSDEPAYQLLTDNITYPNSYFIDPVGDEGVGEWSNNYEYRNYHTQSTNLIGNSCRANGGLDDRFDFIMMSQNVSVGNDNIRYVRNSYHAFGQDGNHFNDSINANPSESDLSNEVLDALYNNSDHLPIVMKILVDAQVGTDEINNDDNRLSLYPNPAKNSIKILGKNLESLSVYNGLGILIEVKEIENDAIELNLDKYSKGMYYVKAQTNDGYFIAKKMIIR